MNDNFITDAKKVGIKTIKLDADFDACKSVPKLMRLCQKTAQKSRKNQNTIFTIAKTPTTEAIYWATPSTISSDIDQETYDEQRKAAADIWTQCLFVDGQTLFVTDHLTFETLAMSVPQLKTKLKSKDSASKLEDDSSS